MIVGPLAEAISVQTTLWVCALGMAALTLATLTVRDVRQLERNPAPEPQPAALEAIA